MLLLKKFIEARRAQYDALKDYPTGILAARKGFYLIKGTTIENLGLYPFNRVPIANCLWSEDGEDFIENSDVLIQLPSLFQPFSVRPIEIMPDGLIGKTIEVIQTGFVKLTGGETFPHPLAVQWKLSDKNIPIKTASDLVLSAIFRDGEKPSFRNDDFEDPSDFMDLSGVDLDEE